ncbi:hypothetical protein EON81_10710 [bacterium]|nr:MAG: hypothetical protein EON81_10710 [bacterium]
MPYPDGAALTAYLASQGLPAPSDPQSVIDGVIADWETDTGWRPFLAESTVRGWRYNPPIGGSYRLDLEAGFAEIAEVRLDATRSSDGVLLYDDQFELEPLNAPMVGRPATTIRFLMYPGERPGSVLVKGRKGWGDVLPANATEAILHKAAALALPGLLKGASGAATQEEIGDRKIVYDTTAGRGKADRWMAEYDAAVTRYRRVTL